MPQSLFVTADGSHTLYSERFAQHYHSTHGAVQESMYIFIGCGLEHYVQQCKQQGKHPDQLRIFEVGFGTGLNALLSLLHCPSDCAIHYESVELYPVQAAHFEQLQFNLPQREAQDYLLRLHNAPWGSHAHITPSFTLRKVQCDALAHTLELVDLVYFDAFSPEAQPELWRAELFAKLYASMRLGGVLTTYCAKGEVRRRLEAVGFTTERLPGPPGKREILRATKICI